MKIVNIIGGLGNQMFQYAFAIALKKKYPDEKVYIDTQNYRNAFVKTFRGNNFYHNGFEIDRIFPNAKLPIASARDIAKVSYYIPNYIISKIARKILPKRKRELIQRYFNAYIYLPEALEDGRYSYFDGYWMSPEYIEDSRNEILSTFEFPPFQTEENIRFAEMLVSDNSVSLHIRRGDYVNAANFKDICTLDYYRSAVREARRHIEKPVFFIFSNDQEWCMENLKDVFGDADLHFVGNNKGSESYRDMQLMSLARCNILANSSFSWWGAFLNNRKDNIVFVPNHWTNNLDDSKIDVNDWIKI